MKPNLVNVVFYGAIGLVLIGFVYLLDRRIGLAVAILTLLALVGYNLRGK